MIPIKISTVNKITSLRLRETTKQRFNALGKGKETDEEILLRLIKMAESMSTEKGTQILDGGNVVGTKYSEKSKTFNIEIDQKKYLVVCTFNDLSIINLFRNKQMRNYIQHNPHNLNVSREMDWELDLHIVNVNYGNGWIKPSTMNIEEIRLLYFISLKQVLEETFDIQIYQFVTKDEFLNEEKWSEAYNKYDLSRDSLRSDVRNALHSDIREKLR
jgi:uncharacterized protein YkuJ